MKKLFQLAYDCMSTGESIVLVTIIVSSGSTPRGAGARMLVRIDGSTKGTIGGGSVEYRAQQMAMDSLRAKQSRIHGFQLMPNEVEDLGMICGGAVTVYFQYVDAADASNKALMKELCLLCDKNEDSWLITEIDDVSAWNMFPVTRLDSGLLSSELKELLLKNKYILLDHGAKKYYSEPLVKAGRVYIFGGGHIGQKLVPVLKTIGFRPILVDDKEAFTRSELFPEAEEVVCASFSEISEKINIQPCDYGVIMTRGHQNDYEVLRQLLATKAHYIGMIGSKGKIGRTYQRLIEDDGFTEADTTRINAPIGIDIGSETPSEIAISIAAQLISVRAKHQHT